MTDMNKYLTALVILVIGIIVMPTLSWFLGLFIIPILVIAAAYLVIRMVKTTLGK